MKTNNSSIFFLKLIFISIGERNVYFKVMWLMFFIASSSVGCCFIVGTILDFKNYNITTTLGVVYEQQTQFPSVSFCKYPQQDNETSLESLVKTARFEGVDATNLSDWFVEFNDIIYGKCFRFNPGMSVRGKKLDLINTTTSGKPNNLRVAFHIEKLKGYDFGELLVHIHNHSSPPYAGGMENGGFWMTPGSWNYYQVERKFFYKLEEPYNKCLKDVNTFENNHTLIDFIKDMNKHYTQDYCFRVCSHMLALEKSKCGCNSNLKMFEKDCIQQFYSEKNETLQCISNFTKEFRKTECKSCANFCPLECDSMSYRIESYLENFPVSGNISEKAKKDYHLNYTKYEKANLHFLVLYVYYKDLKYELISQQPKTDLLSLISNIGGILSLFLGISFLSFVELLEILFEVMYFLFSKRDKIHADKNAVENNTTPEI